MKNRTLAAAACIAAVFMSAPRVIAVSPAAAAQAQQPQMLPEFTVVAPDGTETATAALQSPGQWLLVYVFPGSGPSDNLVQRFGESWTPERAARVVFLVSGTPEAAKAYLAGKGGEALGGSARWFADPQGAAWQALNAQGKLAVTGMAGSRLDWKVDGVIADPAVVWPAIEKWLGGGV